MTAEAVPPVEPSGDPPLKSAGSRRPAKKPAAPANKTAAKKTPAKATVAKATVAKATAPAKATAAKKTPAKATVAKATAPAKAAPTKAMRRTVRDELPVLTQLEANERKDIRATDSDEDLRRNKAWDWHKVSLWLVRVAGITAVYVIVLLVVRWTIPEASIKQAMLIAATAVSLATGGVAVAQWLPRRQPKDKD